MKSMTGRERMLATLRGEAADRVPATIHQWQGYHLREFMKVDDEIDAFRAVGLDAVVYAWNCFVPDKSPDWRKTERVSDRGDGTSLVEIRVETPGGALTGKAIRTPYTSTYTEHLFKKPEDIFLYEAYGPVSVYDPEALKARKRRLGDLGIFRTCTNGPQGSPWQDACAMYGTEHMIYRSFDDPEWTHRAMKILLKKKLDFYELNIGANRGMFEMVETGGGAGSNTVISPSMFKEFCLPYDIEQHRAIHAMDPDIIISYHTCGGMMKLLDLIPANGCDCSETLSPVGCGGDIRDGLDERTIVESLGSKVLLMGGLNQIQVLTDGTPEAIRAEVRRCFEGYGVDRRGKKSGYIMMCSDHFFHTPVENLLAYAQAVQELG